MQPEATRTLCLVCHELQWALSVGRQSCPTDDPILSAGHSLIAFRQYVSFPLRYHGHRVLAAEPEIESLPSRICGYAPQRS
jgi:hypothetical protein